MAQPIALSLPRPPCFSWSLLRDPLHLLTRKALQVTTAHRITALLEPFLASKTELLVLLCSFVRSHPVFSRGLGGSNLVVYSNIEHVRFVSGFVICSLTFC
jgi:hypothetical protein